MKVILKTIKPPLQLNYDNTFNSPTNLKIWQKLVPELRKSLEPNYRPSFSQITRWLNSLHKSRRSQNRLRQTGKIAADVRRTHANNRANEVCNVIRLHFFALH